MSRRHAAGRASQRAVITVIAVAVLAVLIAGGASAAWASSPSPAGGSVTPESGWSDQTWYIIGAVVLLGGSAIVVWLKRRGRARDE